MSECLHDGKLKYLSFATYTPNRDFAKLNDLNNWVKAFVILRPHDISFTHINENPSSEGIESSDENNFKGFELHDVESVVQDIPQNWFLDDPSLEISVMDNSEDDQSSSPTQKKYADPDLAFCIRIYNKRHLGPALDNVWLMALDIQSKQKWINMIIDALPNEIETNDNENQHWELDPSELAVLEIIGKGGFGDVHRGQLWGKEVAVKILHDLSDDAYQDLLNEIKILSELRHPNTLLYIGFTNDPTMIVTEWCANGTLKDLIYKSEIVFSLERMVNCCLDIALGVHYIHSCTPPVIHRDLKSENILVDAHFIMKVSDFGLSHMRTTTLQNKLSPEEHYGVIGTPQWMAPEIIDGTPYDEKVDTYSFGILMAEVFKRQGPYAEKGWELDDFMVVVHEVVRGGCRPVIPPWVPKELSDLLDQCLQEDPVNRPSFEVIMKTLRSFLSRTSKHELFYEYDAPRLKHLLKSEDNKLQNIALVEIANIEKDETNKQSFHCMGKEEVTWFLTRLTFLLNDKAVQLPACTALAELMISVRKKEDQDEEKPLMQIVVDGKETNPDHGLSAIECSGIVANAAGLLSLCDILRDQEKESMKDPNVRLARRLMKRPKVGATIEKSMIEQLKKRYGKRKKPKQVLKPKRRKKRSKARKSLIKSSSSSFYKTKKESGRRDSSISDFLTPVMRRISTRSHSVDYTSNGDVKKESDNHSRNRQTSVPHSPKCSGDAGKNMVFICVHLPPAIDATYTTNAFEPTDQVYNVLVSSLEKIKTFHGHSFETTEYGLSTSPNGSVLAHDTVIVDIWEKENELLDLYLVRRPSQDINQDINAVFHIEEEDISEETTTTTISISSTKTEEKTDATSRSPKSRPQTSRSSASRSSTSPPSSQRMSNGSKSAPTRRISTFGFDLAQACLLTPLQKEAQRVLLELVTHVPEQLQFLSMVGDDELSFVDEVVSKQSVTFAKQIAILQLALEKNRGIINEIRTMRSKKK